MDVATHSAAVQVPPAPLPRVEESVGIEAFRAMDRMREALTGQATGGVSPVALALAYFDWSIHLASAPGKRAELVWKAWRKAHRYGTHLLATAVGADMSPCIEPLPGDYRFSRRTHGKSRLSISCPRLSC